MAKTYQEAIGWLTTFGYIDPISAVTETETVVEEGFRRFQLFYGLAATGDLTPEVADLLKQARCSIPDIEPIEAREVFALNAEEYVIYLTENTPIKHEEALRDMINAFSTWDSVLGITFNVLVDIPDPLTRVKVYFASGEHGDKYPFNGIGGTLAHAWSLGDFSPFRGEIHFDSIEKWNEEFDLQTVATHEIGHVLGLRHNGRKSSIMYPFFTSEVKHNLDEQDVRDLLAIHGGNKMATAFFPQEATFITGDIAVQRARVNQFGVINVATPPPYYADEPIDIDVEVVMKDPSLIVDMTIDWAAGLSGLLSPKEIVKVRDGINRVNHTYNRAGTYKIRFDIPD